MWGEASRPCSVPSPQEAMLKALQKSVEEEEQVWKARVSAKEEELQKVPHGPQSPQGPPSLGTQTPLPQNAIQFRGNARGVIWVTWESRLLGFGDATNSVIVEWPTAESRSRGDHPQPHPQGRGCWSYLGVGGVGAPQGFLGGEVHPGMDPRGSCLTALPLLAL